MRRIMLAGVAISAVAALAACSGAGSGGSAINQTAAGAAAAAPTEVTSPAATSGSRSAVDLSVNTKIRTASLSVSVRGASHVARQADAADDVAVHAGGEIDSDERTGGHYASATLHLRVPPDRLASVLDTLARLGHETSRQVSSKDVTAQVADVGSRVASARQAIGRLRTLYAHAAKVTDVIAIEDELSTREADLESLQAQQRALSRKTAMAAVTLYLRTGATVTHHADDRSGFLGGLSRGWDAFLSAAKSVATGAGAVLPFLGLLLVLLIGARLVGVPGLRRRRRAPAPEPSPAE